MPQEQPQQMMLLFENLHDAVTKGIPLSDDELWFKRATLREGNRLVQEGPLRIDATEGKRAPIVVNVTEVTHTTFGAINDEMATADGAKDAADIKQTTIDIYVHQIKRYPELKDDHAITFIRFENPQPLADPNAPKPKMV